MAMLIIIGCPGSGKSTMTFKLKDKLKLARPEIEEESKKTYKIWKGRSKQDDVNK